MKKPEIKIPTLIGILVAVGGLVSGMYLLRGSLSTMLFASAEETPKEIKTVNITDKSFTVTWITDKATTGFVQYGEGANAPELVVSDDRDQEKGGVGNYFAHFVTIKALKPDQEYGFKIGSGRAIYDDSGQVYKVMTGAAIADTPAADVAYGQVAGVNGDPAEGAIVYLQIETGSPLATLVKSSGSWVIPLATMRTQDLGSYLEYDKEDQAIEVMVQGGVAGVATVKTTTGEDSPMPTIVLGQNADLTQAQTQEQASESGEPIAESRFTSEALAKAEEATGAGTLVLSSPKTGEGVNSDKPVVMGRAPTGTVVTIEVNSETAISSTVKVGSDGTFAYTVPTSLPPGEHTVKISAVINGVVKTITRSFTVYAAGESTIPAFVATPSATLVPTVSPTSTPVVLTTISPTPTRTPTPSPSPTEAPREAMPATGSGTPVSGTAWPTWIGLVLGMIMMGMGVKIALSDR